jgi:hypothetical protein
MALLRDKFKIVIRDSDFEHGRWKERVSWLLDNYGPIGERWDYNGGLFWFKTGKDKMLFVVANS